MIAEKSVEEKGQTQVFAAEAEAAEERAKPMDPAILRAAAGYLMEQATVFEAKLTALLAQKEPEEAPGETVNEPQVKIASFWAFVPESQEEVDRLSSALEQSSTWLDANTARCAWCSRRIPVSSEKCEACRKS